jgi:hypothetical protein
MAQTINRTGEMHVNRNGQHLIIVRYDNNKNIVIWCYETEQVRTCRYYDLKQGRVYYIGADYNKLSREQIKQHYNVDVDVILQQYGLVEQDRVFKAPAKQDIDKSIADAALNYQCSEFIREFGVAPYADAHNDCDDDPSFDVAYIKSMGCIFTIVFAVVIVGLIIAFTSCVLN